jgi:hypothetical protein
LRTSKPRRLAIYQTNGPAAWRSRLRAPAIMSGIFIEFVEFFHAAFYAGLRAAGTELLLESNSITEGIDVIRGRVFAAQ